MPRTARADIGGLCYHVVNRGNGGAAVFLAADDYRAFVGRLAAPDADRPMPLLAFCLMPNHIHLVVRPRADGDLGRWMQWLLTAHVRRHHRLYGSSGHVWQGRYKAFPIEQDEHLLTVLRYVEANPLRAGLVDGARAWPWSSLALRGTPGGAFLAPSPVPLGADWERTVEDGPPPPALERLRRCVNRGTPYGGDGWVARTADRLGLQSTLRNRGRPKRRDAPPGQR